MVFEDLKGIGKARITKLRQAGYNTPLDLLLHFPYKYIDLSVKADINGIKDGDELTVLGTVQNDVKVQFLRKGLRMAKAQLSTVYGIIEAAWFNQKYIASALPRGKMVLVTGKVKKFRNKISLSAPIILQQNGMKIMPLYRNIPGVPQKVFSDAIDELLSVAEINGYIPDSVRKNRGLMPLGEAFKLVHRPSSMESAYAAARTLSVEKLGYTLSMFNMVKETQRKGRNFEYRSYNEKMLEAVRSLPFELTESQKSALYEIIESLTGDKAMNRLLQGDVGCGKTVVALLSMYFAYLNGYQSVLLAPTEILAVQHYKSAIKYFERLGVRAVLLCGSLTKSERDLALFNIRTKAADMVIGTHALISDDVVFNNLSLIVTDEQQRFGVNQRGSLENKAPGADTLVMTATPIPRTLALCMYGELEQSFIKSLPDGRPEIITKLVPENKFQSMYEYLAEKSAAGEQTYIVCPRIDSDDEAGLVSAEQMYEYLTEKFPETKIGLLHGKLRDAEKNAVMSEFICGKIGILVATTVIEVGIDVPAAANIVICNPERYGLSQLHQLRGRVGRGNIKSYCFLPVSGEIPQRLEFFRNCNDGFELSEYDFAQRGAGDFIGTRQHGESGDLPVKIDARMIAEAKAVAEETLRDDDARIRLRAALSDGAEQYVRSITMN